MTVQVQRTKTNQGRQKTAAILRGVAVIGGVTAIASVIAMSIGAF